MTDIPDAGTFFESLEGAEQLPADVRYTRGEARDAALRQLVVRDPRSEGESADPVLVVSAGNRAHLVRRFLLRFDGVAHTVDVDDATLEVVKVLPARPVTWTERSLMWDSTR